LGAGQIIERDTSPVIKDVTCLAPVENGGKSGEGRCVGAGNCCDESLIGRMVVRSLRGGDIASIDRIDTKLTGLDRSAYYATKFREMLDFPSDRISMVAVDDGIVIGFIMARVDYGEFGKTDKSAVIDAIGVHPAYAGSGIGHKILSQLLKNLSSLKVELVRTKVEYENYGLRNFLCRRGFRPSQWLLLAKELS
jgi:predicted N-acetyltransferase YhbS